MYLNYIFHKISSYFYILKILIRFNDTTKRICPCDVLLFCQDVDRGISLNKKAYSPLMDSVRDDLERRGFSCLSLTYPPNQLIGKKAHGSPMSLERLYLIEVIKDSFSRKVYWLRQKIGCSKEHKSKVVGDLDIYVRVYKKLIEQFKPRLIITICTSKELAYAARISQVFHVELLHSIGDVCLQWNWGELERKYLPQGILSLDEVSSNTYNNSLQAKGVFIKTIPHPFIRRFIPKNWSKLPREWKIQRKNSFKYQKEILVTLSQLYSRDLIKGIDYNSPLYNYYINYTEILENGLFFEELTEVIRLTKTTIFWRFRFHPVQMRQKRKYARLFSFIDRFVHENLNCEWNQSSTLPLPSVASQCSGNIMMCSSSCYDVAYLGVKTLALCPTLQPSGINENRYLDLVEKGYVVKQKPTVIDILNWVENIEKVDPLIDMLADDMLWDEAVEWLFDPKSIRLSN